MASVAPSGACPLTQQQLIDEYFIEHRTKILDIAAFLDRFDRASAHDGSDDFRMRAFRKSRTQRIIFVAACQGTFSAAC